MSKQEIRAALAGVVITDEMLQWLNAESLPGCKPDLKLKFNLTDRQADALLDAWWQGML